MNFQSIIEKLDSYWKVYGCTIMQPYTSELGAGTLHPATSISVLSGKDTMVAYVQPVIRPSDGRYGQNPNRLYQHHQYQVIVQPSRNTLINDYLTSLEVIGISKDDFDIRFIEDDWENPSIGAFGFGWEVSCNGMEITQFTYMQQVGGIECTPIPGEIAYGLERIAMILQDVDNVYDLDWNGAGVKYGDIFLAREKEFSALSFEYYDVEFLLSRFENSEKMCTLMVERDLPIAGYDFCIQASHVLNIIESRGVIGVNERASYILRVRKMANMCCNSYIKLYRAA